MSSCQPCSVADARGLHAAAHMGGLQGCDHMPAVICLVMKVGIGRPACWGVALNESMA